MVVYTYQFVIKGWNQSENWIVIKPQHVVQQGYQWPHPMREGHCDLIGIYQSVQNGLSRLDHFTKKTLPLEYLTVSKLLVYQLYRASLRVLIYGCLCAN